ncbi:UDP-N-acetyl glucosamine 2-epimerase [Thermotoga profunda]|uniref:UDP-N-acetyl glucosamine 2-epimerase n=1 Tax=Thermotoga profunda TaxID=1508420 RepID=UPI001184E076|nr:UDP-N-acetyl glucosamine 2-epimerase [Thermotoga profunda]
MQEAILTIILRTNIYLKAIEKGSKYIQEILVHNVLSDPEDLTEKFELLMKPTDYPENLYGDGQAGRKIAELIVRYNSN